MENNNLEKVEKEYWGKSFYGSKLNTVLLLILIVLMIFALRFMYHNQGTYLSELDQDLVENTEQVQIKTQVSQDLRKDWIIYNDSKYGFSFYHAPDNLLQDPNLTTYSVDALGSGREYRCPLPNNSVRLYSEREVEKDKIDVSNCVYSSPNFEEVATGQFNAVWSDNFYGGGQNIEDLVVDGRPAKLVYGSNATRTLLIFLPQPYIDTYGNKYDFLYIVADKNLMNDIIQTIKFK